MAVLNQKVGDDGKAKGLVRSLVRSVARFVDRINEGMSLDDKMRSVYEAINALDNDAWKHYTVEVYEDWLVYEACTSSPTEGGAVYADSGRAKKYYKRGYKMAEDGSAVLSDDAVEVKQEITYVPITTPATNEATREGAEGEEIKMADKKALVAALCACNKNGLTEADAPALMALDDGVLERMKAADQAETEEQKAARIVAEAAAAKAKATETSDKAKADDAAKSAELIAQSARKTPMTAEEWIKSTAPAEMQPSLLRGLARDREVKAEAIKGILANERNRFTKDELSAMDVGQLERLAELAEVQVDYTGAVGGSVTANADRGPGAAPRVWEDKKETVAA